MDTDQEIEKIKMALETNQEWVTRFSQHLLLTVQATHRLHEALMGKLTS